MDKCKEKKTKSVNIKGYKDGQMYREKDKCKHKSI